jgi:hypothetical protein
LSAPPAWAATDTETGVAGTTGISGGTDGNGNGTAGGTGGAAPRRPLPTPADSVCFPASVANRPPRSAVPRSSVPMV